MAPNLPHRDVGPFLQLFRTWLMGRKWKPTGQLRLQANQSPRPGPPPDLPDGPAGKLSKNYYYLRDSRREHKPPQLVLEASKTKLIGEGSQPSKGIGKDWPSKEYKWREVEHEQA